MNNWARVLNSVAKRYMYAEMKRMILQSITLCELYYKERAVLADIMGKRWWIRLSANMNSDGHCDPPGAANKTIKIGNHLKTYEELLEAFIHEHRHAEEWHIEESHIGQSSQELARNWMRFCKENDIDHDYGRKRKTKKKKR